MRRILLFLLLPLLQLVDPSAGEAGPSILSSDLQQPRVSPLLDPRPRLSSSQQTQILSDVQQHQQYSFPASSAEAAPFSTQLPVANNNHHHHQQQNSAEDFSSLARYKVDRKKQSQQIQDQLQSLQHKIQHQQQQINSQLLLAQSLPSYQQQQQQHQQLLANLKNLNYQFNSYQPNNYQPQLSPEPSYFNEQQQPQINPQLAEFYEKQRQLELLQRQRERLLLEQQELRRQQELLRLQQLQLRTTLLPSTTTTTTTTSAQPSTTTPASDVLLSSPTARKITASENDIFLRAIATHQKKYASTQKPAQQQQQQQQKGGQRQERVNHHQQENPDVPKDILALIQAQQNQAVLAGKPKPQIKVIYQTEGGGKGSGKSSGGKGSSDKDLLLKQLKIALAQSGAEDNKERNVTTRDVVLPNGKKLQVIHAPNGLPANSGTTTTIKPPKAILEELTKGVLPPGADFEVLRQSNDGKLEDLGKNPLQNQPAKKVTFVVLEEQPDGSYKVQGVKGNVEKEAGTDVDSIVERIKKGEIKLPPSSTTTQRHHAQTTTTTTTTTQRNNNPTTFRPTAQPAIYNRPQVSVSPNSVSTSDKYVTSASSLSGHVLNSIGTTGKPNVNHVTVKYPSPSSSTPTHHSQYSQSSGNEIYGPSTTPLNYDRPNANYYEYSSSPTSRLLPVTPTPSVVPASSSSPSYANSKESLSSLLRREGLFAMAKYLRQSGLDAVLNETGPYTIFVPTDKAFRTLLVQLGGPEKAEQKFRDNPRLLSGLLLHHVVPGAFRIESLQDEMTGVSLAGTQLRVNVYSMHDHEWNDIQVTTINGARVAPNKRDVEVPQGLAHAIDRVMFPLPVGDLVQTLQADRERRFSTFLKILHASGLEEMLSGAKTFTVFAPTDAAFAEAAAKIGGDTPQPIWQESDGPEAAKELVLRHVVPTTLYTAGMRYYHQKDTLRQQAPVQIQKTGGRIRVNEGHIVTYNVPATNGVLHAIDTVL